MTVIASFSDLANSIGASLPLVRNAVLDDEIVCLDKHGRRSSLICSFIGRSRASSPSICCGMQARITDWILWWIANMNSGDCSRKIPPSAPIRYADHVEGAGVALFERACKLDLEGIVAKHKYGPYVSMREQSTWYKIRNPQYSQWPS